MAFSQETFPGDGVQDQFPVNIPYLERDHMNFYVDGQPITYGWINDNLILVDTPPAIGETLLVDRDTPTDPIVDFKDGSTPTEADYDRAILQVIYIAEEAFDAVTIGAGIQLDEGAWDAQSFPIKNLSNPSGPQYAATKSYVDASIPAVPVDSVFGRTGAVAAQSGDYTADQIIETATGKVMTDLERTKLAAIEAGATADQTAGEIKTAYESNPDTNPFTDGEQTKLAGVESGAEVNLVSAVFGQTGAVDIVSQSEDATPGGGDMLIAEKAGSPGTYVKVDVANLPTGGGGEANTGSNLGTGAPVFEDKSGIDLRFNTLKSQTNALTIAEDGVDNEIDFSLADVSAGGDSGLMTGADKTKLDGIEPGAEANLNSFSLDAFISPADTGGYALSRSAPFNFQIDEMVVLSQGIADVGVRIQSTRITWGADGTSVDLPDDSENSYTATADNTVSTGDTVYVLVDDPGSVDSLAVTLLCTRTG